jgi:hypothetical protein
LVASKNWWNCQKQAKFWTLGKPSSPQFSDYKDRAISRDQKMKFSTFYSMALLLLLSFNGCSMVHSYPQISVGINGTSDTGISAVVSTEGAKNRQKSRECEEWEKQPISGRWKCIKFAVLSKNDWIKSFKNGFFFYEKIWIKILSLSNEWNLPKMNLF